MALIVQLDRSVKKTYIDRTVHCCGGFAKTDLNCEQVCKVKKVKGVSWVICAMPQNKGCFYLGGLPLQKAQGT